MQVIYSIINKGCIKSLLKEFSKTKRLTRNQPLFSVKAFTLEISAKRFMQNVFHPCFFVSYTFSHSFLNFKGWLFALNFPLFLSLFYVIQVFEIITIMFSIFELFLINYCKRKRKKTLFKVKKDAGTISHLKNKILIF